jgi:hypothetical protein
VFTSDIHGESSVVALSETKFVMIYKEIGHDEGKAVIGDVSGSTITYGPEYVYSPDYSYQDSVAALSEYRFVVTYRGNSGYGTAKIGDVSGNIITYGSECLFNPASTSDPSVAALSSTKLVIAYQDSGNGTAIILPVPIGIMYFIGIAKESGTAGQTVPVIIGGVSDVHSGLETGAIYYSDGEGNLTTTVTDYKIGLAISESEILLSMQLP